MRVVIVLLAGCWTAPRTPPAPSTQPTKPPVRSARIVDGHRWIDIAIDGDPARAQALCAAMTHARTHDYDDEPLPHWRVVRACGARPLPQIDHAGSLLVDVEEVDEWELSLETTESLGERGRKARGTVATFTPFADRAACVKAADEVRAQADAERAQHARLKVSLKRTKIERAREHEQRMCDPARADPDAAKSCELARKLVVDAETTELELLPPNPRSAECR